MEKIITPTFEIKGKRKKLTGYIGELHHDGTVVHFKEYSTYSEAEIALDALAFELLTDLAEQGLVDELPAFAPSTCVYCHKPHHPADCPEMRAMLFASDEPSWERWTPDGYNNAYQYLPLDVDFAPIGPEV